MPVYQAGKLLRNAREVAFYTEEILRLSFSSAAMGNQVFIFDDFFVTGDLHKTYPAVPTRHSILRFEEYFS